MSDARPAGGLNFSDSDRDLLDQLLQEEGAAGLAATSEIRPRAPGARVPLSFAQELLWLLDQSEPGLTAYNVSVARRLVGPLDEDALERALTALVARHEVLRTRFEMVDGEVSQIVDPPAPLSLTRLELQSTNAAERDAELMRVLTSHAEMHFDLGRDQLFRAALVRVSDEDHVLLIDTHHAVFDGWSFGPLMGDLAALYGAERRNAPPDLPPLRVQYGDFAIWQRDTMRGERLERLLAFWRQQLGDATEPLGLPTDFPAPSAPTYRGGRVGAVLSADALAKVKAMGRDHGATLYMTLLAAYATVLHRYTGRDHVLIGSGVAGRMQPEILPLIGYFNNTLVQHADFTGDPSFTELLQRVRASTLGAYDHQEVPLEKLILELRSGQERVSDAALFQAVFTMQEAVSSSLKLNDLEVRPFGVQIAATKFDITLLPFERNDELHVSVHFRSDLYAPSTMERFVGHLLTVLQAASADPSVRISALPLLTGQERTDLAAANATAVDEGPAATLVQLFEAQAARVPARVAVVGARAGTAALASVTYAEANARANQIARSLKAQGVGRGTPVALALDRSGDAIVALLGILKAGGTYVPIPPDTPAARIAQLVADSGAGTAITVAEHAALFPAGIHVIALDRDGDELAALSSANPEPVAAPDDVAYVLFTSGSTGTPKGVAVTHANAVHYARAVSRLLGDVPASQPGDGFAALDGLGFGLVSTLAADLGNTSLLTALSSGGTLHVLGRDVTTEPARFAEYVRAHPIDVLKVTPNHLAALVAGKTGSELASVLPRRWLVVGGEALRPEVARGLLGAGACRLLNHYGPTETTVGVCAFEVTRDALDRAVERGAQTVPIGRPLANTHAYVVDAHGNQQPIGVPGELWIGGAGVAQGYLGRPDLTAEQFTHFSGERVYRTGDRARRLADHAIEFLGRTDDQVKVRGYRVELGEIEHLLRTIPGVEHAVTVVHQDERGDNQVVAYVVSRHDGYAVSHSDRPTPERITEWAAARLPSHMVPSSVVLLDALPLTANGKVDKARLPKPGAGAAAADRYVAPTTPTEETLCVIWQDVLKKERVGIRDNFLDLGGHSLLAIRILGRISKAFGQRLALRNMFESPTVEQLARVLDLEAKLAALEGMSDEAAAQLLAQTDAAASPPAQR